MIIQNDAESDRSIRRICGQKKTDVFDPESGRPLRLMGHSFRVLF